MVKAWICLLLLFASAASAKPPRLTLLIVVDALSSDLLWRMLPRCSQGFRDLTSHGAFFPDAQYDYVELVTASGHATLSTGANPRRHGIVGNRMLNKQSQEKETAFADARYHVLEAPPESDVAPTNLLAETLSDRLRYATYQRGKSIAISPKARAAIALAGRLGEAFWFSDASGKFVTSTYYLSALPAWLKQFNDRQRPQSYFHQGWKLLRPASEYLGEDDRPFEGNRFGLGRTFPHSLTGERESPGSESNSALEHSPFMSNVLVELAKAAMAAEQLGADEVPDLLSVSFSANDYIGHLFGPESWEAQDAMLRLDRSLAELISAAEKAAGGRANLLVILSADHGGTPTPEAWQAAGMPAHRASLVELERGLAQALEHRFGINPVLLLEPSRLYLDEKRITSRRLDPLLVKRGAAEWLQQQPAIALAVAADDLGTPKSWGSEYQEAIRKGYHSDRSGEVLFVLRPFNTLLDGPDVASHGSPYAYDSQVPVVFFGKGVKPGFYPEQIGVVDVAPTAATLLEMSIPAQTEGVPRKEVFLTPLRPAP